MSTSSCLISGSVGTSSKQTHSSCSRSKRSVLCRFLRSTSTSVHKPYFMHVISYGSIFHALTTHSVISFHDRGGLIERGPICNFCLKWGLKRAYCIARTYFSNFTINKETNNFIICMIHFLAIFSAEIPTLPFWVEAFHFQIRFLATCF